MKHSLLSYAVWLVCGLLLINTRLHAQNLNLAADKAAIATSVLNNDQASYAARFATDGDRRTHWLSLATNDQSLLVDLGVAQPIDRIRISWDMDYALNFNLEVSDDGISYAVIKQITANVPERRNNQLVNEYGQLASRGRFVRVRALTQATNHGFAISELEVFSFSNTTTNLALSQPVRATDADLSGTGYLFQPSLAVDGNSQTRWSTLQTTNQALVVDLGQAQSITRIYLNWEAAYGVAFQLQVSADSAAWTTVATYTNNQAFYNEVGVAATGRYVRMLGQQGGQSNGGFSIYELAVYNAPTPLAGRAGSALASISLYPNPTASQATLEWTASTPGRARWTLLNSLGQVVRTGQLSAQAGHNTQALDLRDYAPGSYLLTLESAGQVLGRARVQKTE